MHDGSIPVLPGYDFIAEQLTEDELLLFKEAITSHVACNYCDADYYIAHMRRSMWQKAHNYLEALDSFMEVSPDAE